MPMFDVVCFGEILWDFFEVGRRAGSTPALSPFESIAGSHFRPELGGASANVATGLARLGVRAAVAGAVGDDPLGRALVEHLARDGVDARHIRRFPARTGFTFVVRDAR